MTWTDKFVDWLFMAAVATVSVICGVGLVALTAIGVVLGGLWILVLALIANKYAWMATAAIAVTLILTN